jgi:3-dehydroquinate synthase
MQTIPVPLARHAYDIHVGRGLLGEAAERVRAVLQPHRIAVVADETVAGLYGETLREALAAGGADAVLVTFPAGEASKRLAQAEVLHEALLAEGLDRKSALVALGGGVTGDLAGFVAATFLRGIPFVQAPTSLLAMVDSSSGGKTGVNLRAGKNLVGAFHQPALVLADIDTLRTLPREELLSGLAEVVKHGVIRDAAYFELVETGAEAILALDPETLAAVVAGSCRIKGAVVAEDEREESGVRALLNLGHTFGHAYEAASGYALRHGEAVAMGMIAACHLAERLGLSEAALRERLAALLRRIGLPCTAPAYDAEDLLATMRGDKKRERGRHRFVLPRSLGTAEVVTVDDEDAVREALRLTISE